MACRKNAYRGLTEMSEYLEKQNEEEARRQLEFNEEQRKVWTPPSLLERCCTKFLADGAHRMVRRGGNLASVTSRGCSGCLKEHPKITLDFKEGVATASVSMALDPFVQFFTELPEAKEMSSQPRIYQVDGLLSNHHEKLVHKFGAHLISVEYQSLAASQRAYEKQLGQEELKQAAKKRKVVGEAAPVLLLDKVLEVCYNHTLQDHLDLVEVAWMRTSCKSMGRIAAWMARDRMRAIKLSYSPYIPTWDTDFDGFEMDCPPHRPLDLDPDATPLVSLCPKEPQKPITWKYSGENDPSHVRIEIHLEKKHTDLPEKRILFENAKQLEVASYLIDSRQFREVGEYRARSHVQNQGHPEGSLKYTVTSCTLDECFLGSTSSHGEITVQSIAFTFADLLGIYVRMILCKAKQKYKSSSIKKLTDTAYIKALAKAAREAPGNSSSFRGMDGWDDVYG